jgi:hypothetical protein
MRSETGPTSPVSRHPRLGAAPKQEEPDALRIVGLC